MSYYSPDFDPKKVPKKHKQNMHKWKKQKDERADFELSNHMQIRTMAPFNIRCNTCGHYTNKGTKIQANVDKFPGMTYLEKIIIWRFHVRCPVCRSVICFRTDPENSDYDIVSGGTRSFRSAYVRARQEAEDDRLEKEMEENDPMKILEDRTFASKRELEDVELVEDLMDRRRNPNQTDAKDVSGRKEAVEITNAKQLITSRLKQDEDEIKDMLKKQRDVLKDCDNEDEGDNEILKPSFKFRIGSGKESMLSKKLEGVKKVQKNKNNLGINKLGIKKKIVKKKDTENTVDDNGGNDDDSEFVSLDTFLKPGSGNFLKPSLPKRKIPISSTNDKSKDIPAATAPKIAKTSTALSALGSYSDSSDDSD